MKRLSFIVQVACILCMQSFSGLDSELSSLDLTRNNITDISPLVRNADFGDGDWVRLSGNPLNDVSINKYIPTLKAHSVRVSF